jgi:hypothetical protein
LQDQIRRRARGACKTISRMKGHSTSSGAARRRSRHWDAACLGMCYPHLMPARAVSIVGAFASRQEGFPRSPKIRLVKLLCNFGINRFRCSYIGRPFGCLSTLDFGESAAVKPGRTAAMHPRAAFISHQLCLLGHTSQKSFAKLRQTHLRRFTRDFDLLAFSCPTVG